MQNQHIRKATSNDINALQNIWSIVFDYTDMALFFESFYAPELTLVYEKENKIIAMGFLLPVGNLLLKQDDCVPCAMIYAVATLPESRGLGAGSSISAMLIELAQAQGYTAVVLQPADDDLFGFYSKHTKMREWFYGTEYITSPNEADFARVPNNLDDIKSERISTAEYIKIRETLLADIPHIKYNFNTVDHQKKLCDLYGGGLYKFTTSHGDACAVIERQSDELVCVKELLCPKISDLETIQTVYNRIISNIAFNYPATQYIIRTPINNELTVALNSESVIIKKRFGMLTLTNDKQYEIHNKNALPWYGLAFD